MLKGTRQKDIVVLGVDIGGTEIKFGVISGHEIIAKNRLTRFIKMMLKNSKWKFSLK